MTKVQEALKAIQGIETLKQEAIAELLAERKKIDDQLAQLGHTDSKQPKKQARNTDPSKKHCTLCDLSGHDQRAHRSQGDKKKKFTPTELKELGLSA